MGAVRWTAPGQHVDELKVRDRPDSGEEEDDKEHRPDERHRDAPEALPRRGAIDRGRVEELAVYGLQPGEDADGEERSPPPDVRDDDRGHRPAPLAEPVDPTIRETAPHDRPVEHAERGVEE